jgi:hypothetical protein
VTDEGQNCARSSDKRRHRLSIRSNSCNGTNSGNRLVVGIGAEFLRHQDFVVIPAVMLQGVLFDPVFDKPETVIEPPRLFVAHHDAQLDQFDTRAGMSDNRLARPDIHAPEQALMRLLLSVSNGKAGNSHDLGVMKCAEHLGTAQPVEKPGQRLGKLGLESAAEGFRALFEARQTDAAV